MQDPRERPPTSRSWPTRSIAGSPIPTSDFAGLLNLWRYVKEQQKELSSSAFRRMCSAEFLNYLRIREWQDLDSQLRQVAKQLDLTAQQAAGRRGGDPPGAARRAALAHRARRTRRSATTSGARGTRFAIFPGSALFKKQPPFVMAAELVETSRLWGRVNARIEPEWAEEVGAHLVKRSYSEPHWEKRAAR